MGKNNITKKTTNSSNKKIISDFLLAVEKENKKEIETTYSQLLENTGGKGLMILLGSSRKRKYSRPAEKLCSGILSKLEEGKTDLFYNIRTEVYGFNYALINIISSAASDRELIRLYEFYPKIFTEKFMDNFKKSAAELTLHILYYKSSKKKKIQIIEPADLALIFKIIRHQLKLLYNVLANMQNLGEDGKSQFAIDKYSESFKGNSLSKRNSKNSKKYKQVSLLTKVFEKKFPKIYGVQKKACEIADCNEVSLSKWKNANIINRDLYYQWQEKITEQEEKELIITIENYLKN